MFWIRLRIVSINALSYLVSIVMKSFCIQNSWQKKLVSQNLWEQVNVAGKWFKTPIPFREKIPINIGRVKPLQDYGQNFF